MTDSENQLPNLKKKIFTQKQRKLNNIRIGLSGEDRACALLQQTGYQILARNIRLKNKEVDIVALDTRFDEVVFVEVKTRSSSFWSSPEEAVDYAKCANIHSVAVVYLRNIHCTKEYRFDIIAISGQMIEHFENITWP